MRHCKSGCRLLRCYSTVKFSKYQEAVRALTARGVPDAESSAHFLWQAAKGDQDRFNSFIERRMQREPTQYIIGDWDFHNITLKLKPPVLIPRPETEDLVEYIIDIHRSANEPRNNLLDVGTGTGAIGLALLHANIFSNCTAIDINQSACELARENACVLGLADRFKVQRADCRTYQSNVLFDCVVSNPPYIPSGLIPKLQEEVRNHESHLALDGGEDGSSIPLAVISLASRCLLPNGKLFLELHETHTADIVKKWPERINARLRLIGSRKDFAGVERLFCFERPAIM